jgi:hypothetical protein
MTPGLPLILGVAKDEIGNNSERKLLRQQNRATCSCTTTKENLTDDGA